METKLNNLHDGKLINGYKNKTPDHTEKEINKIPEKKPVEASASDALGSMGAALVNMQKSYVPSASLSPEIDTLCIAYLEDLGKFSDDQIDSIVNFMNTDDDIAKAQAQVILDLASSDKADADAIQTIVIYMNDIVFRNADSSKTIRIGDAELSEAKKDLVLELAKNERFSQKDIAEIIKQTTSDNHQIMEYQKDLALELSENERYSADQIGIALRYIAGNMGMNGIDREKYGNAYDHLEEIAAIKKDVVSTLAKNPKVAPTDVLNTLAKEYYNTYDLPYIQNWAEYTLLKYQ